MKNLKAKMKKQAGFTLIEMLIVVAIVAILVAISIPLVNSSLESARDATDQANERAAKMAAVTAYMSKDTDIIDPDVTVGADGTFTAYYDAPNGRLVSTTGSSIKGYGQCKDGTTHYGSATAGDHKDKIIQVAVDATGKVTITWEDETDNT